MVFFSERINEKGEVEEIVLPAEERVEEEIVEGSKF